MLKRKKCSYDELIRTIELKLTESTEFQKELSSLKSGSQYGLKFDLTDNNERESLLEGLIVEVKHFLEEVSGRNEDRHKEFVDLIVQKCALTKALEKEPRFSGGHLHNIAMTEELEEVEKRIKEIVDDKVAA